MYLTHAKLACVAAALKLGMEVQSQFQMCGKSLYYRYIFRCVRTLHMISDVWEALAPFKFPFWSTDRSQIFLSRLQKSSPDSVSPERSLTVKINKQPGISWMPPKVSHTHKQNVSFDVKGYKGLVFETNREKMTEKGDESVQGRVYLCLFNIITEVITLLLYSNDIILNFLAMKS